MDLSLQQEVIVVKTAGHQ